MKSPELSPEKKSTSDGSPRRESAKRPPTTWKDTVIRAALGVGVALGGTAGISRASEPGARPSASTHSHEPRHDPSSRQEAPWPRQPMMDSEPSPTDAPPSLTEEQQHTADGPITDPETLKRTGIVEMQQILDEGGLQRYYADPRGFRHFLRCRLAELIRAETESREVQVAEEEAYKALLEEAKERSRNQGVEEGVRFARLAGPEKAYDFAIANDRPELAAQVIHEHLTLEEESGSSDQARAEMLAEAIGEHPETLDQVVSCLSPREQDLLRRGLEEAAEGEERNLRSNIRYLLNPSRDSSRDVAINQEIRDSEMWLARLRMGYRQAYGADLPSLSREEG